MGGTDYGRRGPLQGPLAIGQQAILYNIAGDAATSKRRLEMVSGGGTGSRALDDEARLAYLLTQNLDRPNKPREPNGQICHRGGG